MAGRNEDWADSFDDNDSEYWENYFGGPDDDELERYYEITTQIYEEDYDEEPETYDELKHKKLQTDEEIKNIYVSRRVDIIEWLLSSKFAQQYKNNSGFFVLEGSHGRLLNGRKVDLIEWLFDEGIRDGETIAGYDIDYSRHRNRSFGKLSFSKKI